jgi:hypothetical protein
MPQPVNIDQKGRYGVGPTRQVNRNPKELSLQEQLAIFKKKEEEK